MSKRILEWIIAFLGLFGFVLGTVYPVIYSKAFEYHLTFPIPFNEDYLFLVNALAPIGLYLFVRFLPYQQNPSEFTAKHPVLSALFLTMFYTGADVVLNYVMRLPMWGWHFIAALLWYWLVQTIRWNRAN